MSLLNRRELLGSAAAFAIMKPRIVRGSAANSAVRVGLLGCGGRGTVHAGNIAQHTDARVVAMADLFPDQLERAKAQFDKLAQSKGYAGVAQTFTGPQAYRRIAESKEVDAVVIATPPYFHPYHLAAAVAAGKHVYYEKPVAVDVAGCRRVLEIGKQAEGRLSLDVGFQIRMAPPFVELVRRIHAGALGEIVGGEAHYYCPGLETRQWPGESGAALRVRNWIDDRVLSGDIIVEQNIHALDICNWALRNHPLKAVGAGGRKGRPGDCFSHFNVVFHYPDNVPVSFSSVQMGKTPFEVTERIFGTRGTSQSPYSGKLGIDGDQAWTWAGSETGRQGAFSVAGAFDDNLAQADSEKQKAFIASIVSGRFHNQAAAGVEAALTAMLGREAAYTGREVTWDELLQSGQRWDAGADIERML